MLTIQSCFIIYYHTNWIQHWMITGTKIHFNYTNITSHRITKSENERLELVLFITSWTDLFNILPIKFFFMHRHFVKSFTMIVF